MNIPKPWQRRRRADDEMDREVALHLELEAEERQSAGASPSDAQRAALRTFGSVALAKEDVRETRPGASIEHVMREVGQAARRLSRAPVFSLAAILTLALAMGANIAVFSVVERVLINALPYPESDRLIDLDHGSLGRNMTTGVRMAPGLYQLYAERARTFESIALYEGGEQTLTGDGLDPDRVRVTQATATLPRVLRVEPVLGRWFTPEEMVPGARRAAVISHGLWVRRFGAAPDILSRTINLQGVPVDVVGVMPQAFAFPEPRTALWVPYVLPPTLVFDDFSYLGVARLRDGVDLADARAEVNALIEQLPVLYPDNRAGVQLATVGKLRSNAVTLKESLVGRVARVLWILFAAVIVVLLVACANVATLVIVRADARQREVTVRRALGAGAGGLARMFLTESTLLSVASSLIGLALGWAGVTLLVASSPATLPRLHEIRLDAGAVVFSLAVMLLSSVIFGASPLLRRTLVGGPMRDVGRSQTPTLPRPRLRQVLTAGQVAFAVILLSAAGLFLRSVQNLRTLDLGFSPERSAVFSVGLPPSTYQGRLAMAAGHETILSRVAALPGVSAVSASTCVPLTASCINLTSTLRIEAHPTPDGVVGPMALFGAVAANYLEASGTRLVLGRGIDQDDIDHQERVAIVNQALVRQHFPTENPIGQRIARGNAAPVTIVGVIADAPIRALAEAIRPQVYMPMSISGRSEGPNAPMSGPNTAVMSYIVRTAGPPLQLLPAVRAAVRGVNSDLALAEVTTLQGLVDAASSEMTFTMTLISLAAGVTLVLGIVGLYGVTSYGVSQRTSEIGLRLALGAAPASVVGMIVRQAFFVTLAGVAVGLTAALVGSPAIAGLLYKVQPRDPAVFATSTLALIGVGLAASWWPARRAARISPLEALRQD